MSDGIDRIVGTAVPIAGDDLDTDRIVPARFLRCVTFDALGPALFRDDRDALTGAHPLDDARFAGATVLLCGRNFGCGSSREHAPQAVVRAGFRAVVAESFAEIFAGNALALGLVCVAVGRDDLDTLRAQVIGRPDQPLAIDLRTRTVTAGGRAYACTLPDSARTALLDGSYDPLNELLRTPLDDVRSRLPYLTWQRP